MLILIQLFACLSATAQNEFAATVFYKELQHLFNDRLTGFQSCKGNQYETGIEDLKLEYKTNCLLPLADSGKIVIPRGSFPYAIFYFEPDKMRLKVDQRALNLREAVVSAIDIPFYARTESYILNGHPFSKTLFFTDPGKESYADAVFVMCIFFKEDKYFLSFEINGK